MTQKIPHITEEGIEKKRCPSCNAYKSLTEFRKCNRHSDGLKTYCKNCQSEKNKATYNKNREANLETRRKYWSVHGHKFIAQIKEKRSKDPEFRKKVADYSRNRRATDPSFKLRMNLRCRVKQAIKLNAKAGSTMDLIGCSIAKVREHLESKFRDGMTWENYGTLWEIDHITPCASFDLSDPNKQKECFHFTNMQPLLVIENKIKSNKTQV